MKAPAGNTGATVSAELVFATAASGSNKVVFKNTIPPFNLLASDVGVANETRLEDEISKREEEEEEEEEEEKKKLMEEKASMLENITPGKTPNDENEEEKKARTLNALFNKIFNNFKNIPMEDSLKEKIFAELWEDFSSNQYYIATDTTNSTQQSKVSIPPTRDPRTHENYTKRLTPPTYFGVGIQTELVREDNKSSYLNITQFYDDSGFESALKAQYKSIGTTNKNFKITAIECDFDGKTQFYTIDKIFEKCGKDEMNFNLKLCDIFRNLHENELKLKFSIDGDSQDKELTIEKSVFTKGENNGQYENIKTVIKQQTTVNPSAFPEPRNDGIGRVMPVKTLGFPLEV